MGIQLYPCYNTSFVKMKQRKRQVWYVRVNNKGTSIVGTTKMLVPLLSSFNNTPIEVSSDPFIVRILDTTVRNECSHYWVIKRTRGICTLCGAKRKFVTHFSMYTRTVFITLYPCFDQFGHNVYRKDHQVYKLRVFYGNGKLIDTNHFITMAMVDGYAQRYIQEGEGYRYYMARVDTTPYIVGTVKRGWSLSRDTTDLQYLGMFQSYDVNDYCGSFNGAYQVALACKQIITSHVDHFGSYEQIYFNSNVPLQVVKHFQGRYGGVPDHIICMIRDKSIPLRKAIHI